MKTTQILEAVEKFAEFDERRHEHHKGLGLHKVRVNGHMVTRGELLTLLRAETMKLKLEGR